MNMSEHDNYIDFMCNPMNAYRCGDCPERCNSDMHDGYPCGQQVCWVVAHMFSTAADDKYPDDDEYVEGDYK